MKRAVLAIALLMSGAAVAQTTTVEPDVHIDADVGIQPDGDLDVDADVDVDAETTTTHHSPTVYTAANMSAPASMAIVQPSNANPEHDARGIAVISDPALVPAGWNGLVAAAMGGPLVDPETGETLEAADDSYPSCTASVTDNCVQSYERGVD